MSSLSANSITVPAVYGEIFKDNFRYFILASGRISGKTTILVALWWATINKYPDKDIVILQSTATEIKDSIIVEIEKFLNNSDFEVSENPNSMFYIPKSKEFVKWKGHKGATYFFPITDSNGGQRSRGITTPNPLSLVMYEEAQKNKDRNVVEQSVATFIRQLDKEAKLIIVGNNETIGHWFIDYVEEKRSQPDWCYIYANCFDIWGLLNEQTKKYILDYREANPIDFKRMYLGDIYASTSDVVFPQFNRKKHYKLVQDIEEHYITKLIIGLDHATANDKFAVVPVAILDDGTAEVLEVLCDDPKETNITLAPTEQCELLDKFVAFLDDKYGFSANHVGVIISCDAAASPFIAQLKHTKRTSKNKKTWRNIQIRGFTMKKKDTNLGIIKNAFAYGVLTILNEGRYTWDGKVNKDVLVREIEQQRYKKINQKLGLDPRYENDCCDALEYGLIPYYTNCYNLSFPVRVGSMKTSHYDEIRTNTARR